MRVFEAGDVSNRTRTYIVVTCDPGIEWAILLTHTDDIDCIGTSDAILTAIFNKMREEWEIKETNPSYMLGIERRLAMTVLKPQNSGGVLPVPLFVPEP